MARAIGAVPVWFGRGSEQDGDLLQAWRQAPLTYQAGQEIDHHWNVDRYETILGQDPTGELFQQAANLTLNNRFYPPEVMVSVSDYDITGRTVQPGDRVLQRIRLLQVGGYPLLEALTLNEITEVIETPRKVGFTYTTTANHSEIGEWSPSVEWRENGEVALIIEVVTRVRPGVPGWARRWIRRMQIRAHKLSIQHFQAQLNHQPRGSQARFAATPTDFAPLIAGVVTMLVVYAVVRRLPRR